MRIAWLALVFALAGCGRSADVPRLPHLDSDAVVLAFGDSLTYGYGASREEAYPARLAAQIHHTVINAGVSGETSAEGLKRLPGVLDESHPQLVLLCLGGNDMLRQMDRAAMRANLAAMIREIRASGAAVVLLGVPEPKLLHLTADPSYASLAEEFKVPLLRDTIPDVLSDRSLHSDEIHPNAAGYQKIADGVAELLRKTGAI